MRTTERKQLIFTDPVAWGLADGGNVISTDGEMIFYGILDVLAKPGYTLLHLFAVRGIAYERFGLASGHASVSGAGAAGFQHEKHGAEPVHARPSGETLAAPAGTKAEPATTV